MDAFTVGWLVWIVAFLALEGVALAKGHGATLSEHVWMWFGIGARPEAPDAWTRGRRIFLLGFMAWLTVHVLTGGSFV